MKFNPEKAPTDFLKSYGEFLVAYQNGFHDVANQILKDCILKAENSDDRILLALGEELCRNLGSFEDVLENYLEITNAVLKEN